MEGFDNPELRARLNELEQELEVRPPHYCLLRPGMLLIYSRHANSWQDGDITQKGCA